MRKIVLLWMGVWVCSSVSYAVWDYTIVDGQYEYGSVRLYNDETLLVTGGGAYGVEAFDSSYVEVQNTGPYQIDVGGIADLNLDDSSSLLVTGGEIGGIDFRDDATAVLRGGSVNYIRSFQYVPMPDNIAYPNIEMVVRVYDDSKPNLITGIWNVDNDNNSEFDMFSIQLHDQVGYDPVIDNITFTVIPEPATLLLFGFGGLVVREIGKKKSLK